MTPKLNTTVTIYINGDLYIGNITLKNSEGKLNITNWNAREYVILVAFLGDDNYKSYRTTDKLTIKQLTTTITIVRAAYDIIHYAYSDINIMTTTETNDITLMYRNGTRFEAIFSDSEGNPIINTGVAFNINGVFYIRTTDENGAASIAINLAPGEYTITTFNTVTGEQKSNKITVLSPVVGTDLTKKYSEKAAYEVCAYDNQGNALANATITININGVFYQRITDDYGIARLNINLTPGEYIATAAFNGALTSNIITVLDA